MQSSKGRVIRSIGIVFFGFCFLFYYATLVYSELYQPRNFGLVLTQKDNAIFISKILADFPANRAGLAVGDQIISIDNQPIKTLIDWLRFDATRELGGHNSFKILRANNNSDTTVQVTLRQRPGPPPGWFETKRTVQAFLLLTALILALAKSANPLALTCAFLLAGIGTAPAFPESEMTAIWRNLPLPINAILWIPQITHLLLLPLLFTFLALVPQSLFKTRVGWLAIWMPGLALAAWCLPRIYYHIYHPPTLTDLPPQFHFAMSATILFYGFGSIGSLWINYHRVCNQSQRRQILLFAIGSTLGLFPLILFLTAIFAGAINQSPFVWFFVSAPFRHFTLATFILFPVSATYFLLKDVSKRGNTETNP